MTPEGRITNAIIRYLKRLKAAGAPVWWVKLHGSRWQKAGIPDLLVVCNGRAIFLEVKQPGEGPTKLQAQRMKEIRHANGRAAVVCSVDDVKIWIHPALH